MSYTNRNVVNSFYNHVYEHIVRKQLVEDDDIVSAVTTVVGNVGVFSFGIINANKFEIDDVIESLIKKELNNDCELTVSEDPEYDDVTVFTFTYYDMEGTLKMSSRGEDGNWNLQGMLDSGALKIFRK